MFLAPTPHNAKELAHEVAGAVETMDTKLCALRNYSSHGTGGGLSEAIFDCGSNTNVEITIGVLADSNK